jgi:hypothetical protein
VSRLALQPRETAQSATPTAPVRADVRPREPSPPLWLPPRPLTPELIAAYKRKGDCLRAQAFVATLRRAARWLWRGSRN